MKIKAFIFPTIVLLWMVFFLSSPVNQKNDWKGSMEEIDGMWIVNNPKEPMYDSEVFRLEEELCIGKGREEEEYLFSNIGDLDVDDIGRIYVLDRMECQIKVFDAEGKYNSTIGNKGQGPGEMSSASSIQITLHNHIALNDSTARKIHFFGMDGKFSHAVSQRNMAFFSNPLVDSKGNITASYMIMDNEITYVLKKFDPQLKEISTLFSTVLLKYPNFNPFFPQCYWDLLDGENIVWGFADKYEIFIIDSGGKTIKIITRDYNPIKIQDEEKEKRIEGLREGVKLVWNEYHNPFIYLCVDDTGRIFTRTYKKAADSGRYLYDVFDPSGKYLAQVPLKSRPYIIKKGKLYTVEEDEEGYQYVKRYRISWNIKAAEN
jgi:hypothetical protein